MSVGESPRLREAEPPPPPPSRIAVVGGKALTLVLPLVVAIGIVVLLAMGKVDQTAGVSLLAAIVGVHLGKT